jgi:hypothetical protein
LRYRNERLELFQFIRLVQILPMVAKLGTNDGKEKDIKTAA